ncbi:HAD family hydrolase [Undibacterium arcticum]|uniref:HAD family hydrolase n=2 Tax=Undibacterium arcticum TaxID=1762892 RepID=A0ABV7F0C2_9BURK
MQPKPRAAFFDIDNTLLNLKSMFSFQEYFYAHAPQQWRGRGDSYAHFVELLHSYPQRDDRLALNRFFYESYEGRRQADVSALAERWFASLLQQHGGRLWLPAALDLARRLKARGYLLVAVSGSCHEILTPVLRHLAFDHCLATRLEVQHGLYTGKILPPQVIGNGKAQALLEYARSHSLELQHCVACGDHITDLPMLEAVGMSYVVAGDSALEQVARIRNWPVLDAMNALHAADLAHA